MIKSYDDTYDDSPDQTWKNEITTAINYIKICWTISLLTVIGKYYALGIYW